MKALIFRIILIIFLALLQLSIFDIAFPDFGTPLLILASVVAWVAVEGFFPALRMTVPLTLLFEIFASDRIGPLSVYGVLLAYATSFLSKRVHIEQRGYGLFSFALVAALGAWGYRIFQDLLIREPLLEFSHPGAIAAVIISGTALFFPLYFLIRRFERSIDLSDRKQMQNIR